MDIPNLRDKDEAYEWLVKARIERELREEALKEIRDLSRQIVIQAVTKQGISVAKASELSGHNRQSITTWLQIHNAEEKGRRLAATGE